MKIRRFLIPIAATVFIGLGAISYFSSNSFTPQTAQAQAVSPLDESQALLADELNTIEIVDLYGPSVVAVNVEVRGQRMDPFGDLLEQIPPQFRDQFRFMIPPSTPQEQVQRGSGSGFVVNEQGQIITNYHVVRNALQSGGVELLEGANISVSFPNQNEAQKVRVIGVNPSYDLALLELENGAALPEGVQAIPMTDSETAQVGQKVIAIGNPFGLQSTVTTGIVSAIGRDVPSIGRINVPMIQTDAAINPGNSGGPLLNSRGELLGINTAIIPGIGANGQRGFLGIGFATPSSLISETLPTLQEGGYQDVFSSRPRLGVTIQDLRAYPESVRQSLNLPSQGLAIVAVQEGSPAEKAGLLGAQFDINVEGLPEPLPAGGDIITAIDGEAVTSGQQVQDIVFNKNPGDVVTVTIIRDGKEQTVEVTLEVVPLEPAN